jgi:uncharacterized membrane protein
MGRVVPDSGKRAARYIHNCARRAAKEVSMESRAKLFGHPVHPILIVFPLGLLITSLVFDFIRMGTGDGTWSLVGFYMIGAGIIGGLLAAVFGAVDFWAIPQNTRAKALGWWHGIGNVVVVGLFIISWFLRRPAPADPPTSAFILSILGVLLGAITGWLGGELVDRLGIGVDDGANPDAPSSLKTVTRHRPAA